MLNTIRLLKGTASLTRVEIKKFEKGDTIWGNDSDPEELQRWSIDQKEEAKEELAKFNCTYENFGEVTDIEEYALEYFEADEDGEFYEGSDYDLAEEKGIDIRELRLEAGMTQREFAEYFNIPVRSIENWEGKKRECPEYVLELIKYKLEKENMI